MNDSSVDTVVVGAGLAGIVTAERLASQGEKVLILEKKDHIGGHCFDYLDAAGIYIHKYGPHIFHTNNKEVWDYLSRFTQWHYYHHKVLGLVDGQKVPIPFNLNSLHRLFPRSLAQKLETKLLKTYSFGSRIPILKLKQNRDKDIQFLARYIYKKIFLNYTMKQWGTQRLEDLDTSVSARVPVVLSRDDRYFSDIYQGIPLEGYTETFKKMLDQPNIRVQLNTEAMNELKLEGRTMFLRGKEFPGKVVFTGELDALFNSCFGELKYRSLDIQLKTYNLKYYQENSVVNYPENYDFTRVSEFKYFQLGHESLGSTTIVAEEYPAQYIRGKNNPYYIVKSKEIMERYMKYKQLADQIPNFYTIGRLAEYTYYNMDEIIAAVLDLAWRLKSSGEIHSNGSDLSSRKTSESDLTLPPGKADA